PPPPPMSTLSLHDALPISAFWHRDLMFNVFTWAFWLNEKEEKASLAYLDDFRQSLAPLANGHAYQNYPNRGNRDYRWMYWGENFTGLLAVKQKYDSKGLFHYGQCVSPVPSHAGHDVRRPGAGHGPDTSGPIKVLRAPPPADPD